MTRPAPAELRRRYGDLAAADVAGLDAAAVRSGVSVVQLMEMAGWQVARCAWRLLHRRPARLAVVVGRGNNGGDGAVAARHLSAWGCQVVLVLAGDEAAARGPLAGHLVSARACGVRVEAAGDDPARATRLARDALPGAALVLDAVLGTGLRGTPRDLDAAAISAMAGARVLSIDVPSGLDATTGQPFVPCVRAAATCTLAAMKRGLWQPQGRARAGTLYVADIGMPPPAWREAGLAAPTSLRGGALLRVPAG
jgi:NAD(P)H-hydrate epimerase